MDRALSGPDISEGEHEITPSDEELVVEKRTVPKDRVRLTKDVEFQEVARNGWRGRRPPPGSQRANAGARRGGGGIPGSSHLDQT